MHLFVLLVHLMLTDFINRDWEIYEDAVDVHFKLF